MYKNFFGTFDPGPPPPDYGYACEAHIPRLTEHPRVLEACANFGDPGVEINASLARVYMI